MRRRTPAKAAVASLIDLASGVSTQLQRVLMIRVPMRYFKGDPMSHRIFSMCRTPLIFPFWATQH